MVQIKKNLKIEISTEGDKILLKINYNWAACLNADYNGKSKDYFLVKNSFNFVKLKKLLPNYTFPFDIKGEDKKIFSTFQLRPYQKEDVEFLSQKKNVGIFNEMRTGKTPTALAIFQCWPVNNCLIICPGILQQQ